MKYGVLAAVAASLCSCHSPIKEDRTLCPTILHFDILDSQGVGKDALVHLEALPLAHPQEQVSDTTTMGSLLADGYSLQVRRSNVIAVYGAVGFRESHIVSGREWVVEKGQDGDRLYRFFANADGMDDYTLVPVEMTKEHSTLHIVFKQNDSPEDRPEFPFWIKAVSTTTGWDLWDGTPVMGEFCFVPEELAPGEFEFTVPRQADHSLALELWAKPGVSGYEGHVDDLVLWPLLKQVDGFDWGLKNLPDMNVVIDYFQSEVTVSISEWQTETSIDYAI